MSLWQVWWLYCGFSRFGSIVRTNKYTNKYGDERFAAATLGGVSNEEELLQWAETQWCLMKIIIIIIIIIIKFLQKYASYKKNKEN